MAKYILVTAWCWSTQEQRMAVEVQQLSLSTWRTQPRLEYQAPPVLTRVHVAPSLSKGLYGIGHVTLVAIAGTNILVPYLKVEPLQLIWRLDTHRFNLWVFDFQGSCRDLTAWQGTRIIVGAAMIACRHDPLALIRRMCHKVCTFCAVFLQLYHQYLLHSCHWFTSY